MTEDNTHCVRKELREMIVFAPQDVTRDPPFTKLDLVTCRNVLIYMDSRLQQSLLPIFHYTLRPGGLLFLGPSESLGDTGDLFETVHNKWKIYRRKETRHPIHTMMPSGTPVTRLTAAHAEPGGEPQRLKPAGINSQITSLLLAQFAPTCLVVNEAGEILYIHGRTGRYLEPSQGQPSHNALEMAREGLSAILASLMRRVNAGEGEVVREAVPVRTNGETISVRLSAKKVEGPEALRDLILITFEPSAVPETKPSATQPDSGGATSTRAEDLEWELKHTKETLQTTVEELETLNEELKSANEELQSTNEELQSTNEELETSKEELQSLNEELTTVNAELNSKVGELSRANDDMHNLLNSTQIATIFLDTHLRVKRYTNQAQGFVRLIQSDIGRPLGDLATNLKYAGLVEDCGEVLRTLSTKSMEVQTDDGRWQLMRVMPYRTTENVIDGVVITLVDISRIVEMELGKKRTEAARDYFESIVQTIREPLLVLDDQHGVVSANTRFLTTFDQSADAVVGRSIYDLGRGLWDIPELHRLLDDILPENHAFDGFRVESEFPHLGRRAFLLNARRLARGPDLPGMILLAFEGVPVEDKP